VLLARANALWVWIDLSTGKPVRIPADFLASFSGHIVVNGRA